MMFENIINWKFMDLWEVPKNAFSNTKVNKHNKDLPPFSYPDPIITCISIKDAYPIDYSCGLSSPIMTISTLSNGYDYNFGYYDVEKNKWINVDDMREFDDEIVKLITHWMYLPEPK